MLEVEKRWSVDLLVFTTNDPFRVASRLNCIDKLNEILSLPAQVRLSTSSLPQRKLLSLQQAITEWDLVSQRQVFPQRLAQLANLQPSAAPDIASVIDGYERVLATYLEHRALALRSPENRMQPTFNSTLVIQDAVKELELLDKRRKALAPEPSLSVNSTTNP
jgi:hypothetical protein